MNETINLIKFDLFSITRKDIILSIAVYVMLLLISIIILPEVILITIMLFPPTILEYIFSHDKKYSGKIYGILPLRRSSLANARYLLSGILILGVFIISVIILMISKAVGVYNHITIFNYITSLLGDYSIILTFLAFLLGCIYSAIFLFSNIAFAGKKAELSTVLTFIVFSLVSICILLLAKVNVNMFMQIKTVVMKQITISIFSVITGLVFMILSYIVSRNVLVNKDLSR